MSVPHLSPRGLTGLTVLAVCGAVALATAPSASAAQPDVGLGTATSFAVLAGSTVTNVGPTSISGDVGVSPGQAVPGLTSSMVSNGTIHRADATAASAQADLTTAYDDAAGRTPVTAVPTELGGRTLGAGVYGGPTLSLTGSVTLDAAGDPAAVFVFQSASSLVTASSSRVELINGADACHVFWQVGSSATLGTQSTFVGSILALTSISANTSATVRGRLLARNAAVTLDDNTIVRPACGPTTGTPSSSTPTGGPTSSRPGTAAPTTTAAASTSRRGPSSPSEGRPTVGSLNPSDGSSVGGTTVGVTGSGFVPGGTSVTIGGVVIPARDVDVSSPSRLSFVTPPHTAGRADLTVTTRTGTSTAATFTYTAAVGGGADSGTVANTGTDTTRLIAWAAALLLGGVGIMLVASTWSTHPRHRR